MDRHKPDVAKRTYDQLSNESLKTLARTGDAGAQRELDKRKGSQPNPTSSSGFGW